MTISGNDLRISSGILGAAVWVLPKNKEEHWQILQEEWSQIDSNVIQSLVDSMPRQVAAVIESKGHPTKY